MLYDATTPNTSKICILLRSGREALLAQYICPGQQRGGTRPVCGRWQLYLGMLNYTRLNERDGQAFGAISVQPYITSAKEIAATRTMNAVTLARGAKAEQM